MERSGPDDARDDAPDDAWGDAWVDAAPSYPPAPIPAHERTWRHPSEIGQAAWATSEPPVTLGRGLLITSGAIGSALGVAVLYLLLPAGIATPSASPTVTSSISTARSAVTVAPETTSVTAFENVQSTSALDDAPDLTLPAPDTPSTVLVMALASTSPEPVSVAVAIEGDPYVVTTANALESIGEVNLLGPGDRELTPRMSAELISIEGDLAYLSPSAQMEVVSFASTASAEPGQIVTVLADVPTDVSYVAPGTSGGVPELDAGRIVEGTPVIDATGALVALCTLVIDADGAHVDMVAIEAAPPDDVVPSSTNPSDGSIDAGISVDPGSGSTGSTDTNDGLGVGGSDAAPGAPAAPAAPGAPGAPGATTPPTTTTTTAPGSPAAAPSVTTVASTVVTTAITTAITTGGGVTGGVGVGPSAWVGLRFDGPPSAPLTITGVVAGSPAMAAGVMVGERVVAIDGADVATIDDVVAALKRHQPGDLMRLTLVARSTPTSNSSGSPTTTVVTGLSGSQNSRTVSVVLAAVSPTL